MAAESRMHVVGLGLLGASFARAVRRLGPVHLTGYDTDPGHAATALSLGIVDALGSSPCPPRPGDLVFLAVPPAALPTVAAEVAPGLGPDTLVLDACSVKGPVAWALAALDHPGVVPCHPVAGWHTSGPAAGREDLFRGRRVALCPLASSAPWALERTRRLWEALGAEPLVMDPHRHDLDLARLSHLPHLAAFALASLAADSDPRLAGPGFRDATRLALCAPDLWTDISRANRAALLPLLATFRERLEAMEAALGQEDPEPFRTLLEGAHQTRTAMVPWVDRSSGT